MLPLCREEGLGVVPWSPLARGFLAGNRRRAEGGEKTGDTARARSDDYAQRMYYRNDDFEVVDRVVELAGARGVEPAQIALAWLLHQDGVTAPIVGATKLAHLDRAIDALDLELSDDELARLEEPYQPHPVLGHE
jgi:aryl-alcohol dehydrogenase (NADP+)